MHATNIVLFAYSQHVQPILFMSNYITPFVQPYIVPQFTLLGSTVNISHFISNNSSSSSPAIKTTNPHSWGGMEVVRRTGQHRLSICGEKNDAVP